MQAIPDADLSDFMPEDQDDLESPVSLASGDWGGPEINENPKLEGHKIVATLADDDFEAWENWKEAVKDATGDDSNEEALRPLLYYCRDIQPGE